MLVRQRIGHGLYPGQLDIGFRFVRLLEALGLAWNVRTPDTSPQRRGISRVPHPAE